MEIWTAACIPGLEIYERGAALATILTVVKCIIEIYQVYVYRYPASLITPLLH